MRTFARAALAVVVLAAAAIVLGPAPPAGAVAMVVATPATGLSGGDTVDVQLTGFTPNTLGGFCQGLQLAPVAIANCSNGTYALVDTDAAGADSGTQRLTRHMWIPALSRWVDCADPSESCVIGAAEASLAVAAYAPLEFATPPPPPATRGTITVTPGTAQPGTSLAIAGSGFRPGASIDVYRCLPDPQDHTDCEVGTAAGTVAPDGTVSAATSFPGAVTPPGQATTRCDQPTSSCAVAIAEAVDPVGTLASAPITPSFPTPQVVPGTASVVEGDSGDVTVDVPVQLDRPTSSTVTVDYETAYGPGVAPPAAAEPGVDFDPVSGTVTFLPGQTLATVPVTVHGDGDEEPAEYVVLAFGNPVGATMGGYYGLGFGVIVDDDAPPVIVPGAAEVVEGDAGTTTLSVPVALSEPAGTPVTVDYRTDDVPGPFPSAEPGVDYEATAGTLTFAPGQTAATVDITVYGDLDVEQDEIVVVLFEDPVGATLDPFFQLAYIRDDDRPPIARPGIGQVVEGDAGTTTVAVPLFLSEPSGQTVTVDYQTVFGPGVAPPDPATPGVDFTAVSGTATFLPGTTEALVEVPVLGDLDVEPDEYVVLAFGNPSGATVGGYFGLGFGVILDDD